MTEQLFDAHGHVWTAPDRQEWVSDVTPPGVTSLTYSLEDYREDMATLEVDRAVLVATPIHGPGSPYTVSCVESEPETFYGIVLIDYEAQDVEAHLESVFSHENLLGVRMTGAEMVGAPTAYWSWMNHNEKQVQLLLSPDRIPEAIEFIDAYPGIDFVFDHLAAFPSVEDYHPAEPPYSHMSAVADYPNAFVKITHTPSQEPFPFADVHDHIRFLYDAFGPERLCWGSDYIYHFKKTTPRQTVEFLEELPFLSKRDRTYLYGRTFDRLLE